MKLRILETLEVMRDYDSYVIPFYSPATLADFFESEFCNIVNPYIESKLFEGKAGEVYTITTFFQGTTKHINLVFVGFGDKDKVTTDTLMSGFGKAVTALQKLKAKKPIVFLENLNLADSKIDSFLKVSKAMILANYSFEKYQTKEDKLHSIHSLDIFTTFPEANKIAGRATMLANNTIIARDLVNEPANYLKPADLAKKAVDYLDSTDVDVKVYDFNDIKKLDMKAFIAVAQGSDAEPKLIVMNYQGDPSSKEKLALVGKGLTFDSGGYSIKPTDGMASMKSDMAGSATVIGAIKSIAEAKLKVNVVAIVAACENMISGKAYLPGDVIGSMNGKTIEVLNTDAEGRLTLADAITYAIRKEHVTKVVDIATLTGAVLVALGLDYAGGFTNNEEFYEKLEKAGKMSNEKLWRLPIDNNLKDMVKSEIADLKNIGGRFAGSSTAAAFIGEFTEDIPWIHIDIAGTSGTDKDLAYCRKGATGYGVELLFHLAALSK